MNAPVKKLMQGKKAEQSKFLPLLVVLQGLMRGVKRWLASSRSNRNVLSRKVSYREVLTGILLMIPSAATTMLTFYGVSEPLAEQGGDIVQKGQALAFSLTIGVFSWLGWFYLFGLIYRLRGRRLAAALAAGTFFISLVALIDAPFNMLALGGGSAVQMTIVDTTRAYEEAKIAAFHETTTMRRLLPAINAQAQRFATLSEGERENGDFSGSAGAGKVAAGFTQIEQLFSSLSVQLEEGLDAAVALQVEIAVPFENLKAETYEAGPLRPRVRRASIAADQLDDLLGQLGQYDYRVSIDATLDSLEAIFPSPINGNGTFETCQNEELAMIAEMAHPVAKALRGALEGLSAVETPPVKRVRPQNAMQAILTKWRELIFQWLAAFFVDLAPAALLIILIAAFREVDHQNEQEKEK